MLTNRNYLARLSDKLRNQPEENYATIKLKANVEYLNQKLEPELRHTICKEYLAMVPIVVYAQKSSVILSKINQTIDIFKSAGLIEFWYRKNLLDSLTEIADNPTALTMHHVKANFMFLFLGGAFSMAVFLMEILSVKFNLNIFRF